MKKLFAILVISTVAITNNTYAQYVSDALRFSQNSYGSTARFKAMGNAQIGLGGDLSSLGGNPAGLGMFTKSELSFTPQLTGISNDVSYINSGFKTSKTSPDIGQFGVAFFIPNYQAKGNDVSRGLVSVVFGLGYNKVNDYKNEYNYGGVNANNSIADYFANLGGNSLPSNLPNNSLQRWAYNDFLISYDNNGYYYPETFVNNIQKTNDIRKGSISEFNFSAAVNISNELYIGANIGIINLDYIRDAIFEESGTARGYNAAGNLTGANVPYKLKFNQIQTTSGKGVNGRIGVIYRPVSEFRFGATIQTPTWINIEDNYTEELDNRASTNGTFNSNSYPITYSLRTPFKGSIGASYIIAGQGLLTADIDYVDYSSIKISNVSSSDYATVETSNNTAIRKNYKEAVNFRVGGEYKIENLSLRAGFGYEGSPYENASSYEIKTYSGGLGYRVNNFYIDGTYQRIEAMSDYTPYVLNNGGEPTAFIKGKKNNIFLTVGIRF